MIQIDGLGFLVFLSKGLLIIIHMYDAVSSQDFTNTHDAAASCVEKQHH